MDDVMVSITKSCFILTYLLFTLVSSDVLDAERSSFFGLTREVAPSASTVELVGALAQAVRLLGRGDRRVRRYYDAYDTPFYGPSRRRSVEL